MEQNFDEQVEVFLRRKWVILVPFVAGALIAGVISLKLPSYYRSTTLILVEQQQVPEKYVTPTDKTPFGQRLSTISQQIMSRTKLEQIIKDFDLYRSTDGSSLQSISKKLGFSKNDGPSKDEILERIKADIEVKVIGSTDKHGGDAFSVSYIGKDPVVTMKVTNTLASLFIEENLKFRELYAEGTSEFITSELERAKLDLEAQEKALRKYKEEHMGSLPEQLDANLRTLDRLQLEMQNVVNNLKTAEDRKAFLERQVELGMSSPGTAIISDNPLEVELAKLRDDLSRLLTVYTENYPDVLIVKNRIKEVEERIKKQGNDAPQQPGAADDKPLIVNREMRSDIMAIKTQIDILKQREAAVIKQIHQYEKRVEEIPGNEQRLADLSRDYNISLQNYQALLEKKLSARLAENLEKRQKGERFRIIDSANLPEIPFKPNRGKITALGAIIGLGAGIGLAFLLEYLNPAFRKAEDFEGVITQPVLTSISEFTLSPGAGPQKKLRLVKGAKGQ